MQEKNQYSANDIIAIDKTPVWSDMVSEITVNHVGKRTITMKTTGLEKCRVSVCVAAKADGTKLKPFDEFKGAKREVADPNKEVKTKAQVVISENDG